MKININEKICIFGTGGFGRETLFCLKDILETEKKNIKDYALFMVDDEYYSSTSVLDINVIPVSQFDPKNYKAIIAVGDPIARAKIAQKLPFNTQYAILIHPSTVISDWVKINEGTIITAGTIITCNIEIGKHAHLNLYTTIGHDCVIGNFFTTAPAVNISGSCKIGNNVYIGTNASIKNGITICDNVTIGMGSVVVKDILKEGIYIGNPAKPLIK
jgi:sugar O-acyltransferase (sialic acid O-acetyltransferase NeuD family)